jgi:hypothetical protein
MGEFDNSAMGLIRQFETMKDKASKDIVCILDGCSHFWKINVNLTKEELFDLKINGSS